MNAAFYIRVSTDNQTEFSPGAQKKILLAYAKNCKYSVKEEHIFIDEGISGTTAKHRPAFMRMIATAKTKPKPFDVILVHKFDRFARSREDSIVYKSLLKRECGINVVSVTEHLEDDKFSVILEAMLEAMAEYYSLNLSDEVMKGMTEKARRGQVQQVAPFGYRIKDRKFIVNPEEAEIVKLIFDKFVYENLHCATISKLINSMGIKNIRGKEWDSRGVKRLLRNKAYIGHLVWNKGGRDKNYKTWTKDSSEWIINENTHEPIVTEEVFKLANKRLDLQASNTNNKRPVTNEVKHYLSGIVRCSNCGGTLIYSNSASIANPYYQCGSYRRGKCTVSNSIVVYKLHEAFIDALKDDLAMLHSQDFEKVQIDYAIDNDSTLKALNKQLSDIKKKYDIAKKAYLSEIDTLEEYATNKAEIKKEEEQVLKLIEDTKNNANIAPRLANKIQSFLSMLDDESIPVSEKNIVLKDFVDKVIVNKKEDTIQVYYRGDCLS